MAEIARGLAEQVLNAVAPIQYPEVPEGSRIIVHSAVSRFSVLYERIRNAIDWKDEHTFRRAAILRILHRQLILESDAEVIAHNLILELIAARYLPNNELAESLVNDAAIRVAKYQAVARTRVGPESHLDWLRRLMAVELEEMLVDATQEKALVTFLYERLADRIRVAVPGMSEGDLRLQIYIACYRTYLKAGDDVLGYKLLRAYLPEWTRPQEWLEDPVPIAERLIGVQRRIKVSLTHRLALKFQRSVRPYAVSLEVLRDALLDKPEEAAVLLSKPEALDAVIARIAQRKYQDSKGRLRRGAVRATFYLFITKMIVAFVLEVPLEYLWYGSVATTALTINVAFPPTLMFFVSLFIHVPGRNNTERIQANVNALLSESGVPLRELRTARRRNSAAQFLFTCAYGLMFVFTFGLIGGVLMTLRFTWLSAAIFYFFLCVVSFFAFRLRMAAREYVIVAGRDRFTTVIFDFLSLPILRAGKWLSRSISRLNVFLFILDFLIEAPFKIFLGVLEEWFAFMKEKKEELQ